MFNLKNVTVLTKAQQKNVRGGGTCAVLYGNFVAANISKEEAIDVASKSGGRWCCDSCAETDWYNNNIHV